MINPLFERNARRNRNKALLFTIAFHALLAGAIFFGNDKTVEEYVPEVVQEWLGMDTEEEAIVAIPEDQKEVIRP